MVSRLQQRDKIEGMHWGLMTMVNFVVGGRKLFHCRFCRHQFYDRRKLSPDANVSH